MYSKFNVFVNYLVTFFIVSFSGINMYFNNKYAILLPLFLSIIVFFARKKNIDKLFFLFIIFLTITIIGQIWTRYNISVYSVYSTYIFFCFPYFGVKAVGKDFFIKYYLNLLFAICIIIIPFYLLTNFFDNLNYVLSEISLKLGIDPESNESIIFYNVEFKRIFGIIRNAGPFWEAGGFAGFLVIGIIFSYIKYHSILNKYSKLFIIMLLSTFSTAGYICLFFLLALHTFKIKSKYIKTIYLLSLITSSIITYNSLEFLNDKIDKQIEIALSDEEYRNKGRIGSALVDIQEIINYPIFGKGKSEILRWGNESLDESQKHRTNGFFDFMLKYGIPLSIVYWLLIYLNLRNILIDNKFYNYKKISFLMVIILIILSNSQIWLLKPIFVSLLFFYPTSESNYVKSNYFISK